MDHICDICNEAPANVYHDNLGAVCRDCRDQYADKFDQKSVWDSTIFNME